MQPGYALHGAQSDVDQESPCEPADLVAPVGCARIQCAASEAAGQARLIAWLVERLFRKTSHHGL